MDVVTWRMLVQPLTKRAPAYHLGGIDKNPACVLEVTFSLEALG